MAPLYLLPVQVHRAIAKVRPELMRGTHHPINEMPGGWGDIFVSTENVF